MHLWRRLQHRRHLLHQRRGCWRRRGCRLLGCGFRGFGLILLLHTRKAMMAKYLSLGESIILDTYFVVDEQPCLELGCHLG
jgi:hypothetical protein